MMDKHYLKNEDIKTKVGITKSVKIGEPLYPNNQFTLKPYGLMINNQLPIGRTKRDLKENETIEIQIDSTGLWTSDAIDFSMMNDAKMAAYKDVGNDLGTSEIKEKIASGEIKLEKFIL